ncbi:hypothetical protein H2O73_09165 [Vibrio sp. 404]|uniref:Uncharacterized protein n=1 Tax=Vibrio marinisediminis TaxID=2758441 RepID=A0A7W2FQV9_9VIBR|nr:hypothetical protein [Vibrio marinisediminis]MBA5762512.1 hypothetical protein [Vibrio marinisediminis]
MLEKINQPALRQLPEAVKSIFNQIDSYDDPCFLFLYSNQAINVQNSALLNAVDGICDDIIPLTSIGQNVSFTYLFCDYVDARVVTESLAKSLSQLDAQAKVALFRHNCIGDLAESYDWGIQQLLAVISDQRSFAINDFTDQKNWSGVDQYRNTEIERQAESQSLASTEPTQQGTSLLQRVFGHFFSNKATLDNETDTCTTPAALEQLRPFIIHLPNGESLWDFVLTGENYIELHQQRAFVNLDSVLVILHSKHYAPDFYQHILHACHLDSIPSQNDIQRSLHKILQPLSDALLDTTTTNNDNQQCFIRVVDIFFHLFDQQDLPKKLYELMVKEEETRCISDHDYGLRYCLPSVAQPGAISSKTKQQIDEIIDDLDSYYHVGHDVYVEIEKTFEANRDAYNHLLWVNEDEEEQTLCRLIGAVLLNLDQQNNRHDDYTLALTQWVTTGLKSDILAQFKQHCQSVPDELEQWLLAANEDDLPALAEKLDEQLDTERSYQRSRELGAEQPIYELFDSVGIFRPILATCYWLYKASQDPFAKHIIQLAMRLAPQATLSSLSRFYLESMSGFASEGLRNSFFQSLSDLGISLFEQTAFNIAVSINHDATQLEHLIRQYIELDEEEREQWNLAINKLACYERDYFYLNAYRLQPTLSTPLAALRKAVLNELMSVACHQYQEAETLSDVAEQFLNGKLSFAQYQSLTDGKINAREFELGNQLYNKGAPKVLPQILTEADKTTQLRWVKLLGSDPRSGRSLQATLLEEIFFDQQLKQQSMDFETRLAIELDDLTPEWLRYWKEYLKEMTIKLDAL